MTEPITPPPADAQPAAMPGSRADVYSKIAAGAASAPGSMEALVRGFGAQMRGEAPAQVETLPMAPGNPLIPGGGVPSGVPPSSEELAAQQVAQPAAQPAAGEALPDLASRFREAPQPAGEPGAVPELPPDDPELVPDPRANPKAAYAFTQLRQAAKKNAERAAALAAELNAIKQAAEQSQREREAALKDLERIRGSHDTLAAQVAKLNLAESPEFKQKYEVPVHQTVLEVVKILRDNSVEGATGDPRRAEELAREILGSSPREIVAATKDLPDSLQTILLQKATEMAKLTAERERALDGWKAERVNVEATVAHASKQNEQIQRRGMAEKALEYARKVNPIYGGVTEVDRATSDEVAAQFLAFAQFASPEDLMKCAAEGFASPLVYPQVAELARENAYLKNLLADRGRLGMPPTGPVPAGGFSYGGAPQPPAAPKAPELPPNVQRVGGGGSTTADYLATVVGPDLSATSAALRRSGLNQ